MSLLTGIVDTSPLLGFLVKANEGMEGDPPRSSPV